MEHKTCQEINQEINELKEIIKEPGTKYECDESDAIKLFLKVLKAEAESITKFKKVYNG